VKQVKGFVPPDLAERFRKHEIDFLTLSRNQWPGFEESVTLSPVSPEPKRRVGQKKEPFAKAQDKPDYEAMIEDLEQDFNDTYAWQLSTRTARLKDILKKVRAEHTPKEKPEGKDA